MSTRVWSPATPLAALEAVAIDTETTGLDARAARLVQIGAVVVRAGRIASGESLEQLIDPGIAIPRGSTEVHGIADADVAGMPAFAAFAPQLERFLGGRLVVGHSLAYDLAILKREHELAGLPWTPPAALDVRPLARLVAPALADHSLDRIAAWLGVAIEGRHTAIGDARAAAAVLMRLVPLLRDAGVRTLGEAMAATGRLAEQDARASRGLMVVDGTLPTDLPPTPIDSYAYRHSAADVMTSPPLWIDGAATIAAALQLLLARGSSSVFVRLADGAAGIVTERDVLRAVAAGGAGPLAQPVSAIARTPLIGVEENDLVYRAIGRMQRLGLRHLAVRNAAGEVTGALTPRNLLRDRAMQGIVIGDAIAAATESTELAAAWGDAVGMAASLRRDGVAARTIAGVLSGEIQAITRRATELAEAEMAAAGHGAPPVAYAVLVLGSAGRGESLLAADQDNAIVYAEGAEGSAADRWLEAMAARMNRILDEAGIVLCKGGVMARNRLWRLSREDWGRQVETWIRRQSPQDLLNVDIFFDAEVVHGDRALARDLIATARERARATPSFLMMLGEMARQWRAPLTLLGGFRKVDGRVDLKKGGLLPIVSAARVMALRHGVPAQATADRLAAVATLGHGAASDFAAVIEAHEVLLAAILEQQIEDAGRGVPLSPRAAVERLPTATRARLKSALHTVDTALALLAEGML